MIFGLIPVECLMLTAFIAIRPMPSIYGALAGWFITGTAAF